LWELALVKWQKFEAVKQEPDAFSLLQIASHLALLAEREARWAECLHYLGIWKLASPQPGEVEKRIAEARRKFTAASNSKPGTQTAKP
jgi:hypothetical protein